MTQQDALARGECHMKITAKWLIERNACADQVAIVRREWPNGGEVTRGNLRRAADLGLDIDWLARHVGPGHVQPLLRRASRSGLGAEVPMTILALDCGNKTGWARWDGTRVESGVRCLFR